MSFEFKDHPIYIVEVVDEGVSTSDGNVVGNVVWARGFEEFEAPDGVEDCVARKAVNVVYWGGKSVIGKEGWGGGVEVGRKIQPMLWPF